MGQLVSLLRVLRPIKVHGVLVLGMLQTMFAVVHHNLVVEFGCLKIKFSLLYLEFLHFLYNGGMIHRSRFVLLLSLFSLFGAMLG